MRQGDCWGQDGTDASPGRAVANPCQPMDRVRLQTSTSASNSRAMSAVAISDDNMVLPVTYGMNVNLTYRRRSRPQAPSAKELIWIKKWGLAVNSRVGGARFFDRGLAWRGGSGEAGPDGGVIGGFVDAAQLGSMPVSVTCPEGAGGHDEVDAQARFSSKPWSGSRTRRSASHLGGLAAREVSVRPNPLSCSIHSRSMGRKEHLPSAASVW